LATALKVLPLAESTNVTLAPGISAPDGSLAVPRSEVLAFWLNAIAAQERMQTGNHLQWKILTLSSSIAYGFCFPSSRHRQSNES
jgi:hypothetical protein